MTEPHYLVSYGQHDPETLGLTTTGREQMVQAAERLDSRYLFAGAAILNANTLLGDECGQVIQHRLLLPRYSSHQLTNGEKNPESIEHLDLMLEQILSQNSYMLGYQKQLVVVCSPELVACATGRAISYADHIPDAAIEPYQPGSWVKRRNSNY